MPVLLLGPCSFVYYACVLPQRRLVRRRCTTRILLHVVVKPLMVARCACRVTRRRRPSEERLLAAFLDGQARSAPLPTSGPPSPGTRSVLSSMFFSFDDEANPNRCGLVKVMNSQARAYYL